MNPMIGATITAIFVECCSLLDVEGSDCAKPDPSVRRVEEVDAVGAGLCVELVAVVVAGVQPELMIELYSTDAALGKRETSLRFHSTCSGVWNAEAWVSVVYCSVYLRTCSTNTVVEVSMIVQQYSPWYWNPLIKNELYAMIKIAEMQLTSGNICLCIQIYQESDELKI
jgi:hypothetical protein